MATQTITTTVEQATEALAPARKAYERFGYNERTEATLVRLLTADEETLRAEGALGRRETPAERFRNFLWNTYTGGGVSAGVTREVFGALGRLDETDDGWI